MHKNIGTIYRYLPPFTLVLHNCSRKSLYLIWSLEILWLSIISFNGVRGGGGFAKKTQLHAAFMYDQHLSEAPRGTSCLPGRLSVSGWLRGCSGLPRCGSPMLTSHSADGLPACFLPPHPPPPIFDWLPGWGGGLCSPLRKFWSANLPPHVTEGGLT
jgi:hypothetical protein